MRNARGKVIRSFTVEILPFGSDVNLDFNPSNPYSQLSEEERLKDLIETFSTLWAESCREFSHLRKELYDKASEIHNHD